MDPDSPKKVRIVAKSTLDKFKHQNIILKKFGKDGLAVYKSIKEDINVEKLKKRVQIPGDVVDKILAFMLKKNIIELVQEESQINIDKGMQTDVAAQNSSDTNTTINSNTNTEDTNTNIEDTNIDVNTEETPEDTTEDTIENTITGDDTNVDITVDNNVNANMRNEDTPREDTDDTKTNDTLDISPSDTDTGVTNTEDITKDTIDDVSGDDDNANVDINTDDTSQDDNSININDTSDTSLSDDISTDDTPPDNDSTLENEDSLTSDDTPITEDTSLGHIDSKDDDINITPEDESESEDDNDTTRDIFLTDNEIKVKKKFGTVGLKIYDLIDGKKSVDVIAKEATIGPEFVINILDYMGKEGIIEQFDKKAAMMSVNNRKIIKPSFTTNAKVMLDSKINADQKSDINIPVKLPLDIISGVKLDMELMLKFRSMGKDVYSLVDGKRDEIQISVEANLPIYVVKQILQYLLVQKSLMFKKMARADIRNRYGDPGLAVYKKYGKTGLTMFALTGKKKRFKDIASMAMKDNKDKAAEIIVFIYQVLGLELPVSIDYIKDQL